MSKKYLTIHSATQKMLSVTNVLNKRHGGPTPACERYQPTTLPALPPVRSSKGPFKITHACDNIVYIQYHAFIRVWQPHEFW